MSMEYWWEETEEEEHGDRKRLPRAQCGQARPLIQTASYSFTAIVRAEHVASPTRRRLKELERFASQEQLSSIQGVAWLSLRSCYPAALLRGLNPLSINLTSPSQVGMLLAWQGACLPGQALRDLTFLGGGSASPLLVLPAHDAPLVNGTCNHPLYLALLMQAPPPAESGSAAPLWVTAEYERHVDGPPPQHPQPSAAAPAVRLPLALVIAAAALWLGRLGWSGRWRGWCGARRVGLALLGVALACAPSSSELVLFVPGFFTPLPWALYPSEDAIYRTVAFEETFPPMLWLFAFCAVAPPALLGAAWRLRGLPWLAMIAAALCGYHAVSLQTYWGHRFVHFQMRRRALLPPSDAESGGGGELLGGGTGGGAALGGGLTASSPAVTVRFPAAVANLYDHHHWLGLNYDVDHHLHHADPGNAVEVIEDFGDLYLPDTMLWSAPLTAPFAAALHCALSGGRGLKGGSPRAAAFWRRWAALWLSWMAGGLLALAIYELVHLSSHLPRHAQPEWLWLWSSAHRLHHRNPNANFGFHDSSWDWLFGTLGGPE